MTAEENALSATRWAEETAGNWLADVRGGTSTRRRQPSKLVEEAVPTRAW